METSTPKKKRKRYLKDRSIGVPRRTLYHRGHRCRFAPLEASILQETLETSCEDDDLLNSSVSSDGMSDSEETNKAGKFHYFCGTVIAI